MKHRVFVHDKPYQRYFTLSAQCNISWSQQVVIDLTKVWMNDKMLQAFHLDLTQIWLSRYDTRTDTSRYIYLNISMWQYKIYFFSRNYLNYFVFVGRCKLARRYILRHQAIPQVSQVSDINQNVIFWLYDFGTRWWILFLISCFQNIIIFATYKNGNYSSSDTVKV